MGYIFTIKFDSNEEEIMEYIKQLKEGEENMDIYERFDWCDSDDGYVCWDHYQRDISRLSEIFPHVLITVYQEHEDNSLEGYYDGRTYKNDSMTVQYFKYGKFTKEKAAKMTISFDSFNEIDEELLSS